MLTHSTPGGFRGLYIVKNLSRRTAPKFGTHVRIDTLTLKKYKQIDPPHPRGFRGLNCLARLALARERTPSVYINYTLCGDATIIINTKGIISCVTKLFSMPIILEWT